MTNITGQVAGKSVSHVAQSDPRCLEIHFTDDSVLAIALRHNHIVASLTDVRTDATSGRGFDGPQPTRRQREYLEFIAKYTSRYGVSPAESDIARHPARFHEAQRTNNPLCGCRKCQHICRS